MRARCSIVLSTLGNHAVLEKVLDGYDRQTAQPGSFELLVVVDCKEPDLDAVDRAIGERSYPVRRLVGSAPGLSANRNTGWRAARADVVLFTDNDTIPVPQLVDEHLAWHDRHPDDNVAVVGHVRWAKGIKVTPFMRWLDDGVQFHFGALDGDEASWAHLYGANSSIKRRFLERVGGYDEERLPYLYEDIDWGYRAKEHGLRVLYNRRAIVDHWRPMSLDVWKARAPMLAATEWQFTRMHPDVEPWFHQKFSDAVSRPRARGRGARLARYVPKWVPWLGDKVWFNADVYWRQQIAPHFLASWGTAASVQPDVAALLAERSGPK